LNPGKNCYKIKIETVQPILKEEKKETLKKVQGAKIADVDFCYAEFISASHIS